MLFCWTAKNKIILFVLTPFSILIKKTSKVVLSPVQPEKYAQLSQSKSSTIVRHVRHGYAGCVFVDILQFKSEKSNILLMRCVCVCVISQIQLINLPYLLNHFFFTSLCKFHQSKVSNFHDCSFTVAGKLCYR